MVCTDTNVYGLGVIQLGLHYKIVTDNIRL